MRTGRPTDRRGGARVLHLRVAPRECVGSGVLGVRLGDPSGDALALLSAVVAHPGASLDALRVRACLAPAAFADALRALSRASLITLRTRAREDDPRAKAYPNPSGREVLAAAQAGAGRPAERPPATLAKATAEGGTGL